jgi:hypothetical protein
MSRHCVPYAACCGVLLLLATLPCYVRAADAEAGTKWQGPATDFVKGPKGALTGDWWQGGAVGVAHFTGPGALRVRSIETACRAVATARGMTCVDIGRDDVVATADDPNSALLYPDGAARVRLLMMPGGKSWLTTKDVAGIDDATIKKDFLGAVAAFERSRKLPQQAFAAGMNYVGCCGGAYVGASGYPIPNALLTTWCLWPGRISKGGPNLKEPFPDVEFADANPADHPLRVAGGTGLKNMFFNGGPQDFEKNVPDTEYFGAYKGGALTELEGSTVLIAHLPADKPANGRVVLCSGHPEVSHQEFFKAMLEYAIARPHVVPRNLVKGTKPVKAVSGDHQLHYWCVPAAAGKKMIVTLSDKEGQCSLFVRHDLPPLFDVNDGEAIEAGVADKQVEIESTKKGDYYIGVYGDHDVTAGVPYTLAVKFRTK